MRKFLTFALFFFAHSAWGTTYFLDSSVSSSGNGLSWATAWKNFGNITGLNPGDVVNISGGASGQTYTTGQFLSASGISGNPIIYQVATDPGHNGVVTINRSGGSNFYFASSGSNIGQWVTMTGNVGGVSHLSITGWNPMANIDGANGVTFRYTTIQGQIHANGSTFIELDHVTLDLPSGSDRALQGGLQCGGSPGYGVNKIHDSILMLRYGGTSGFGDDGIGGMECTAFYNNQVLGISDPAYPGSQHQDGIQTGGEFVSVYNNYFNNMQNYPIYGDQVGGGTLQHWRIYNNIFYEPSTSAGNQAVSIGCDGTTCTQSDILVSNNTMVANVNCIFINQGTPGTVASTFVVNNICYNSGAIQVSTATQSNNTTLTTGITFVNPTSDWHLTSGATNAIGKGVNPAPSYLTSVYTTDKDGNIRTNPWDIGAYKFGTALTWYIRADGGTRFSANVPTGQCNGKFDSAYPGSGTNQNCAYKDFRYIWDDDSGVVGLGTWQPAGGDTVVIRDCTANANQVYPSNPNCRIGWDAGVGTAGVNDWCRGVGNNICTNPTITAGTSGAHTRIMSGWAFDHPGQPVSDANKIQLFGGYGLQLGTFNLAGTQWLDLIGIELTTHNQVSSGNAGFPGNCTKGGSPAFPVDCNGGTQPYDDYAQNGFVISNTSANISFTDVKVHGFNASGFWGPIGGPITMTRVSSNNNGFAGWNFADQSDTPNAAGSSITASFVTMNSNGCYEQYPIVSALPLRACYDSNSGGFGDAWSGQDTLMDTFICDHCTMNYNTKDAFIGPHAQVKNLTVTNSVAIGNMGAQMKYGTQQFATTLFQNNLFVMNCWRQTETLPGAPQNFNQSTGLGGSYLTNFCRAGGDGWAFLTRANSTAHFYGNTIVGANSTMMDINCGFVDTGGVHEETNCGTSPLLWTDNNMIGYTDPLVGQQPGLWFFDPGAGGSLVLTADHNNYFGVRNTSPDVCGVNNITCANPLMNAQPAQPWPGTETALDVYNATAGSSFTPIGSSPLGAAGRQLTGLNTDFYGTTRTIPPAIGGVNLGGGGPVLTSITVIPNPGSVLVGSTLPMGCTSTFSDSSTAPCTSPVWTTTGAHTSINVTSGVVTGNTAGSDTITAAIGAISGTATVNVTAVIVPPKGTVTGHFTVTGTCTGVCP